ncbi:MAG: type II toxin-antitoxin system RelE/ParE family toxin [Anaerovibrio sp.]|uniref:type II toxin-antitoxin system RelE/ParE family toxin n=1 Tax=Anaerovibrio sp. TaxID=1872532 RepID=UPI0025BAA268|nr:type II toxin-antitoxin system RelE/ParE family toxin [Anaerovibrio sp.]MBE6100387.1 type II toxin-antitoxin system RelE/ParE family toxin [Anaerovibrio sp.]
MASNSYSYVLTEVAESDIDEALAYIAVYLKNPDAAASLLDEFDEQVENICLAPQSGKLVENEFLQRDNVRRFLVKNYIVYYLVDDEARKIVVLRFVYGRRHQEKIVQSL